MPHPLSARRCTMLFHLFILLQLLSPGDLVCVRRLLSTDEEGSQDQEGEMTLKKQIDLRAPDRSVFPHC